MGIYASLKSLVRSRTPYYGWGGQGGGYRPYTVVLPGTTYDYGPLMAMGLWKNATVASGIHWLSRNWTVPHLQVVRVGSDGIKEPIRDHPALGLLRRPHKRIGESAFIGTYVRDQICYGNNWIEKVRNGLGEPVELKHWRPDRVNPIYPTDGSEYLTYWRYNINGSFLDVQPDNVIHVRQYIDMDQDRSGWCPLHAAIRAIATLNEAQTYTASLLRNFGVPGMIATPKGDFTVNSEDALAIKQKLQDATSGDERGGVVVLTGAYDIVKSGMTPEEIGLHLITKVPQAEVLSVMGLNPDVLGLNVENSGAYGSYAEAIRAAYVHGLIPLQKTFADEMTHQLLVDFEDPEDVRAGKIKFSFDYSPVEELDDREQISANRAIRLFAGGVTTLNESRDIVGKGKSDSADADLVGIDRDKLRAEMIPQGKVSEGDNIGSIKVPPSGMERSKIEGERNSDPLSPSRSGVNKSASSLPWYHAMMEGISEIENTLDSDDSAVNEWVVPEVNSQPLESMETSQNA